MPPSLGGAQVTARPRLLHLEMRVEPVGIPIGARVRELIQVRVVDAAMAAVGIVVHEELDVCFLGLQPHRGAQCAAAAAAAAAATRPALPPLPVAPGSAPPRLYPRGPGGGCFPRRATTPGGGPTRPEPRLAARAEGREQDAAREVAPTQSPAAAFRPAPCLPPGWESPQQARSGPAQAGEACPGDEDPFPGATEEPESPLGLIA